MRSIEREGDDIVTAAEVDLSVASRTYHDILLSVDHVGGGWCMDAGSSSEAPQFLAIGRIVSGELAVALTRENKAACGGENATHHWFWRLDLPFYLAGVVIAAGNLARRHYARIALQATAEPQLAIGIR